MSDHIQRTIADLTAKISALEDEIVGYKKTVNLLCDQVGMGHAYDESELSAGSPVINSIKPDTFYGQPLNTSIRKVLEMRKAQGMGPASAPEIHDTLEQGGFQFGASSRDNAIRGLRISLGKSSHTFHKLPNGSYGLASWYPDAKTTKSKNATAEEADVKEDESDDLERDEP